jgi:hypothetical protein
MTYVVIWPNANQKLPECFHFGETLTTFLDPDKATQFPSIAEAQAAIAAYNGTNLDLKPVSSISLKNAYLKEIAGGFSQRSFPCLNTALSRPYKKESASEVLAWHIAVQKSRPSSMRDTDIATWPTLHQLFKHIFNTASFYSPDYKEKFFSFEMCVDYDSSFDTFKKELDMIIDHITLLDNKGNKLISVFDHFLCEHGNKAMFVCMKDGTYQLISARSSRGHILSKGTLEHVFKYWRDHRPYKVDPAQEPDEIDSD